MRRLWRNRSILGELGCAFLTVIVFTLPLWALTAASRGPRYALTVLVGLAALLFVMVLVSRAWRR
jgi:hypothetical protein